MFSLRFSLEQQLIMDDVMNKRRFVCFISQARAKLPKKRRRVLPVEQPRRKKMENATNRRMNAIKHHHPAVFKDAFGGAKLGKYAQTSFVFGVVVSYPKNCTRH